MSKRAGIIACAGFLFAFGAVQMVRSAPQFERRIERNAEKNPVTPHGAAHCEGMLNVGYRVQDFSGLKTAIWYPTLAAETSFQYPAGYVSPLAPDAPVANCGAKYPLVLFSHGYGGCGTQSTYFTEAIARAGYIVVAPDHKDSQCKIDRASHISILAFLRNEEEPFRHPEKWSESTYRERYNDMETLLNELPNDPQLGGKIDFSRIAATGHSLGGYVAAALGGAWPSWKDNRIKAVLMLCPYLEAFQTAGTLGSVQVPVMIEGGTKDPRSTPAVKKAGGAYDKLGSPKYFVDFQGAGHLTFTQLACEKYGSNQACLDNLPLPRAINEYGIAFLNRYLKNRPEPLLDRANQQLADYRHTS